MMDAVPIEPEQLPNRCRAMAAALVAEWPAEGEAAPPEELREAAEAVRFASVDQLSPALRRFVEVCSQVTEGLAPWSDGALGALTRGLYSAARQHEHSPEAKETLRLCNAIRVAVDSTGIIDGHPNELMAALMVVEDAVSAIEGYAAFPPFAHADEAYLAKYGLLQAVQLGFDGAEAIARLLGAKLRADSVPGGKAAKIARNIVAGHPIGGNMAGESWHHFHDRSTAHDNAVIRVMSFSRADAERWSGQTLATNELVTDGLAVIAEVLRRSLAEYEARHNAQPAT